MRETLTRTKHGVEWTKSFAGAVAAVAWYGVIAAFTVWAFIQWNGLLDRWITAACHFVGGLAGLGWRGEGVDNLLWRFPVTAWLRRAVSDDWHWWLWAALLALVVAIVIWAAARIAAVLPHLALPEGKSREFGRSDTEQRHNIEGSDFHRN